VKNQGVSSTNLFLLLAVVFIIPLAACTPETRQTGQNKAVRPTTSFEELSQQFSDPDMLYAPFTFWFWDTNLEPELVREMTIGMMEERMNPGYAHPRHGLPHDEWLSQLWFECLEASLEEAKAEGMFLGFCDEYWWPSGRADGRLLEQHPELQAVSLKWEEICCEVGEEVPVPPSFFTVAAKVDESGSIPGEAIESSTLEVIGEGDSFTWRSPEGKWKLYVFNKYFEPGWDGGDVNYLDKRLAPEFIEIAHKPYLQLSEDLGKSIPGVFVDHEGDYGWKLAWSDDLEKDYAEKKRQDIRRWMPLMIDKDREGKWVTARYDWYDVVSDIYAGDFLGAVSDYLDDLGMYTISNLWEETLFLQAATLGDAFKAHRAVTMPGNDCLFEKGLLVHDFKEIQSVTEFEGRRFQSELLGAQGWHQTPLLMKQVVNSVTCWGVSHMVPHGINLNRAMDSIPFPADWFTSNPYWPYMDQWNDFARRASYINSHGYTVPDVLVLNPMGSVWSLLGGEIFHDTLPKNVYRNFNNFMHLDDYRKIQDIHISYSALINELTDHRIEFLIADEYYLSGMEVSDGGTLLAENHEFSSIVLPDLFCLQTRTAAQILNFMHSGGKVYYYGELPVASVENGLDDPDFAGLISEIAEKAVKITVAGEDVVSVLDIPSHLVPQIEFESGSFEMYQSHREIDGRHFFWLVNNAEEYQSCRLLVKGIGGRASKWNCENGSITSLASVAGPEGSLVEMNFKPVEAFWLVFEDDKEPLESEQQKVSGQSPEHTMVLEISGDWTVSLDLAAQPDPFKNQVQFPEYAEMATGTKILTPWEEWGLKYFTGYIEYETEFVLESLDDGYKYCIDLGKVNNTAEVWINGTNAGGKMWPPFVFDITEPLIQGENSVRVKAGNTMYNIMRYYLDQGTLNNMVWVTRHTPEPEEITSGMFGPVVIRGGG